jgi:antitoxin component YwqK of YwqJK toxin-antitoxin module
MRGNVRVHPTAGTRQDNQAGLSDRIFPADLNLILILTCSPMRAGPVLAFSFALLPFRVAAQSEVGLILNAIFQGLQTAEAIRRSVENSQQFPAPPGQPPGDPIWDYEESSLVPVEVLRKGPYRNISGAMVLSARQTPQGQVELIFYRADGTASRREFVRFDRRDGRRTDLDERGNKTAEGPIRGGLPEGDWQFFSAEGKLRAETRMLAGKMTGPQILFNPDGRQRAFNTLVDGKRQGPSTLFHPDGSVSDNLHYIGDQLEGPAQGWWPDGTPRYTATWKGGKLEGPSLEYFPSGAKRSEAFYVLGKKDGPARTWNEKGELQIEESWRNDQLEGLVREFSPDGNPKVETNYRGGKKNGLFRTFGADGSLATSGEFQDDKLSGPLLLHYPGGKTFAECQYEADRLIGGRLLYPDGKLLGQFGPVVGDSGKVSSLWLQYPDGKPRSSARFDAAAKTVSWQGWTPDGSPLGPLDLALSPRPEAPAWRSQQESLEAEIGLSFPPEFDLVPR